MNAPKNVSKGAQLYESVALRYQEIIAAHCDPQAVAHQVKLAIIQNLDSIWSQLMRGEIVIISHIPNKPMRKSFAYASRSAKGTL